MVELTPSEECQIVEVLRTDYSVREICETLGFTRSNLYYQPKKDPCEPVLRDEIEKLAAEYPTYGYRRITQLLVHQGYTVGYRRVARFLKRRFVYVAVLMDVFTRVIRGWQLRSNLSHSLTLSALEAALEQSVPEIHHSDQGVQYLSSAYVSTLLRHGNLEISVAHRGCPWENG